MKDKSSLLRLLFKNSKAKLGFSILSFFIFISLFAPFLVGSPTDYVGVPLQPPNFEFWFGTNGQGQDVLAQTVYGGRKTLFIAFITGIFVVMTGAIFGGILSVYIFDWLLGMNHCSVFDVSCWTAIKSICIMEIVGDFGLYCGHRLLHEVPFLYNNYHCYHHRIGTPTALSTASIDAIDETIQATLPIFYGVYKNHTDLDPEKFRCRRISRLVCLAEKLGT